jgi:hypothetical protein
MPSDPVLPATAQARFFGEARECLRRGTLVKLVLAGPRAPKADLQRVLVRPLVLKGRACLSLTYNHRTRDVTKNLPVDEALATVATLLEESFDNLHLLSEGGGELQLAISRKGKASLRRGRQQAAAGMLTEPAAKQRAAGGGEASKDFGAAAGNEHDRVKRRPVDIEAPWLAALGVTDAQHRLVPSMARKWKQINKFVEVLDHALAASPIARTPGPGRPLQVLDFGAGKGYLTFAVHDHLRRTLGRPVQVTGVDLKDDMVRLGNETARRLGLQPAGQGLHFELGDVSTYATQPVDIMIALHACDTATDHAMHMGVRAGAAVIMCSPCCHKQLRPQMRSPLLLLPLLRHGIHLGQEAEMLTDGLRALLLEAEGYDTQVFEFTSLEHTSKNKMILAVKRAPGAGDAGDALRSQIRELKTHYGVVEHCLESLLEADRAEASAPDAPPP